MSPCIGSEQCEAAAMCNGVRASGNTPADTSGSSGAAAALLGTQALVS